jgi:ABC-type transport system involved in multi-copper enzyme maturation permease subunit
MTMLHVINAELRKLRRPTLLYSTILVVVALTGLFTSIVFLRVESGRGEGRRGEAITIETLSQAQGLAFGFKLVAFFLGITALCVFASQTAQEYSLGTLRNLLVRQPARMKILAGKYVSMTIFAVALVLADAIVAVAISYGLAGHAKVNTTAWFTATALAILGKTFLNVLLATMAYGTLGMILGLLFRSPISAIATGVIWTLILENILSAVVSSTTKWLPGQNFTNISQGGSPDISYHWSLIISVLYLASAFAVVAILFKRRDVAN